LSESKCASPVIRTNRNRFRSSGILF